MGKWIADTRARSTTYTTAAAIDMPLAAVVESWARKMLAFRSFRTGD
jgi:hypothetical protein